MFIRAYLRASTINQNAKRAKKELDNFVAKYNSRIASYYIENESGTKIDRPELMKLLNDSRENDILLVENIDRLSRLKMKDWELLKKRINEIGLIIVSADLPLSWHVLDARHTIKKHDFVSDSIIKAMNAMLIEIMAIMARNSWEVQLARQKQGIERAKNQGKYKGRKADVEKHQMVIQLRKKDFSIIDISKMTGYSRGHIYRILESF